MITFWPERHHYTKSFSFTNHIRQNCKSKILAHPTNRHLRWMHLKRKGSSKRNLLTLLTIGVNHKDKNSPLRYEFFPFDRISKQACCTDQNKLEVMKLINKKSRKLTPLRKGRKIYPKRLISECFWASNSCPEWTACTNWGLKLITGLLLHQPKMRLFVLVEAFSHVQITKTKISLSTRIVCKESVTITL